MTFFIPILKLNLLFTHERVIKVDAMQIQILLNDEKSESILCLLNIFSCLYSIFVFSNRGQSGQVTLFVLASNIQ